MAGSQKFGIVAWTAILLVGALRNSLFNGWFGTMPAWMAWVAAGFLLIHAFHKPVRDIRLPKGIRVPKGALVHVRIVPPNQHDTRITQVKEGVWTTTLPREER